MLDDYFLLVRRIPGISLSVDAFWEMDTYTTGRLLEREKEIMKKEEDEYNKQKGKSKPRGTNSEEMEEIMEDLQEEA
jgi:hypothetical protein